jgi:hypothetical protein
MRNTLIVPLLPGNLWIHPHRRTPVISGCLTGRVRILLPNKRWDVSLDSRSFPRKITRLPQLPNWNVQRVCVDLYHSLHELDLCTKLHGSHSSLPYGYDNRNMANLRGLPSSQSHYGCNCDLG